jgi:transposase-like protein
MSGKQTRRRRVKRSEAEWRAIVKRFERSGLSRGEFCGREGVAASSLSKWRQEFGGRTRSRGRRAGFVEVLPPSSSSGPSDGLASGEAELALPGGVRLRWRL